MPDSRILRYKDWIQAHRLAATDRGGEPWSAARLAAAKREAEFDSQTRAVWITKRKPGEFANTATGEVFTGCVTIGKLAETMGVTTDHLTIRMEQEGFVERVLAWKGVPMICARHHYKPRYFMTPQVAHGAVENGHLIPVRFRMGEGKPHTMILVTPEGRIAVQAACGRAEDHTATSSGKAKIQRETVLNLHRGGMSPSEIVSISGISRRTVFRRLHELRHAA